MPDVARFSNVRAVATAVCLVAGLLVANADVRGQEYRFGVPSLQLQATIQKDGSAKLEYAIEFQNMPGAHAIDIVDVGLPHSDYELSTMTASLGGSSTSDIRPSTIVNPGVECHASSPIPPGESGTFQFSCDMPEMVYQDTTNADLASFRIKPTWFDPNLTVGNTNLQIAVHLPPGVKVDELKYQNEALKYDQVALYGEGADQHLVAIWEFPDVRLSDDNPTVAVSFPKRTVDRVISQTFLDLAWRWWKASTGAQFVSGALLVFFWWFIYYRFANGTGWIVGILVTGAMIWIMTASPAWHLLLYPILGALCALNEWALSFLQKKQTYLPAMATVEGGGIKRGLTAPLAAAILEKPLGVVATLTIFGLLKKGVLELTSKEPPVVRVTEPYRKARRERLKEASKVGTVIHAYEQPFLDVLQSYDGPLPAADLRGPLKELIESLGGQLKGFDLAQTREYYQKIVDRAWIEAESIGKLDQKQEVVDRNFEWMAMDPDWIGRLGRSGGYRYDPPWYRTTTTSFPSAPSVPSPAPTSTPDVSFGDVAGSFTGWMENRAGSLVSSIEPVSLGLDVGDAKGLLDLTGVDKVTGDVFEALASGKGGGGGGGGGCACACAGCACACACAGGGR